MGWISSFFSNPIETLGNTGQSIIDSVNKTADAIIRDPVPIVVSAIGAEFGVPTYVSAAAVVASRGGSVEDIAKTAALSFATANVLKATPVPDITAEIGKYVGSATTASVGNAVASGLNTSVVAGINAVMKGKPVSDAMAAGFTTGAIGSGVSSGLSSLNADQEWGLSKDTLSKISGVTSAAITGAVTGKDPAAMIGNYIANSILNVGKSEIGSAVKKSLTDTQKEFDKKLSETNDAQKAYNQAVEMAEMRQRWEQQTIQDYNRFEIPKIQRAYDLYQRGTPEYYAEAMATLGVQNKTATQYNASVVLNDYINSHVAAVNNAVSYLETPAESNKLIQAANAKYDAYTKALNEFTPVRDKMVSLDNQFQQLVADTATHNFTIDAINSGVIKPIQNPRGKEGFLYFDNGMSMDKSGNIYQNDSELFTDSAVDPKVVDELIQKYPLDESTGYFKVQMSGVPLYAGMSAAKDFAAPLGTRLATADEAENKNETGAYYDLEKNAWLVPVNPETQESVFDPTYGGTLPVDKEKPDIIEPIDTTGTGTTGGGTTGGGTPSQGDTTDLGEIEIKDTKPDYPEIPELLPDTEAPDTPKPTGGTTGGGTTTGGTTTGGTTTGGGTTGGGTTGGGTTGGGTTPVTPAAPQSNLLGLLALLEKPQQQAPVQTPLADIKYFYDITGSDILPPTPIQSQKPVFEYAEGGTIEDLIRILRS